MLITISIIAIIAVLVFIAGYCNGTMDWIKFKSLDKEDWKNKWKLDANGEPKRSKRHWYYFGLFTAENEERKIFSSTFLVFLTDTWHLKKWQMFLCYEFALSATIVYYNSLPWWLVPIGIIALKGIRGLGFISKYDKK